jgi:DNA-binding protein H-NS
MRTWEYKKIALNELKRGEDEIDLLCDAGEERWELVAVLKNGIAYLKREVMASARETDERLSEDIEQPQAPSAHVGSVGSQGEAASSVRPKYRDPVTGETWSGRGRMASWLKRKLDAGEDIDKYLVKGDD